MSSEERTHSIVVVCGSVRPNSMTSLAMRVLVAQLSLQKVHVDVVEPLGLRVAYLGAPFEEPFASELRARVAAADGVILCTPEYNGTFSSVLMAIIENLGYPVAFAGKPVGLLGVAGGKIGAIKALEHLRSVCAHSGALVLPGAISVADVHRTFDKNGRCTDPRTSEEIRGVATAMVQFLRRGLV